MYSQNRDLGHKNPENDYLESLEQEMRSVGGGTRMFLL